MGRAWGARAWWAGRHCVSSLCGVGHAWTLGLVGLESGGSFRTVALVSVWGLGLMIHGGGVDYGNTPDNAYSQGSEELNASAGTC